MPMQLAMPMQGCIETLEALLGLARPGMAGHEVFRVGIVQMAKRRAQYRWRSHQLEAEAEASHLSCTASLKSQEGSTASSACASVNCCFARPSTGESASAASHAGCATNLVGHPTTAQACATHCGVNSNLVRWMKRTVFDMVMRPILSAFGSTIAATSNGGSFRDYTNRFS